MVTRGSLHTRIVLMTTIAAALAVIVSIMAIYTVTERSLHEQTEDRLARTADVVIGTGQPGGSRLVFSPAISPRMAVYTTSGQLIPAAESWGAPFDDPPRIISWLSDTDLQSGDVATSFFEGYQVLAKRAPYGQIILTAEATEPVDAILQRLLVGLTVLGAVVMSFAILAGSAVARTGLRPIRRLTGAMNRVARTDVLTPVPITGDDELAQLAVEFNAMLAALEQTRERQRELIADAGAELDAPLQQLRADLEALLGEAPGDREAVLDDAPVDREALAANVVTQIDQLSTKVGELVDRARQQEKAGA